MQDLPREKLEKYGVQKLEDHELLSVILSRGSTKESVFDLSRRLLSGFDREEIINERDIRKLQANFRIGYVQAGQIMAAIELGRRFFRNIPSNRQISTTNDAYELVKNMQYLKKEYVRGLYINTRYHVIHNEIISIGSLDANILHPREIFKPAIEYSAYAVILVHNHPSGDPNPSNADLEISNKLIEIGNLLQIPLIDHLIIGENSYYSFGKNRILTNDN